MTQQVSETLNPSNAALLLIDHQVGTMNCGISDLSALELKNQTLLLAESARAFGLPVILTASNPNGPKAPSGNNGRQRRPEWRHEGGGWIV